jgi:hypothetical protein
MVNLIITDYCVLLVSTSGTNMENKVIYVPHASVIVTVHSGHTNFQNVIVNVGNKKGSLIMAFQTNEDYLISLQIRADKERRKEERQRRILQSIERILQFMADNDIHF